MARSARIRLLLLLLLPLSVQTELVLYVDGLAGSDSYAGTQDHPFKTIQHCHDRVSPKS